MLHADQISNVMAIVAGAAAGVMLVIALGHFLAAARRFRPRRFCRDGAAASGAWQGETPEASALFVAGRDYPIRITSRNEGGPARLAFARFGEFTPITYATLSASFSKSAVIFEKGFTDVNGKTNCFNSSVTQYRIRVNGGQFGGILRLCGENLDRLRSLRNRTITGDYIVPAGRTFVKTESFVGESASSVTNDIAITAIFEENETDLFYTNRCELTAFEIAVENAPELPTEHTRHRVGVGEISIFSQKPCHPQLFAESPLIESGIILIDEKKQVYISAPTKGMYFDFTIRFNNVVLTNYFRSMEPEYLIMKNPTPLDYYSIMAYNNSQSDETRHLPLFKNGDPGVIMKSEVFVRPDNVSFYKVKFYEGEAPAENLSGIFVDQNTFPPAIMRHSSLNGAGTFVRAVCVDVDNSAGCDLAGFWLAPTNQYCKSSFLLRIPNWWYVEGRATSGEERKMRFKSIQKVVLHDDGAMSIRKQGAKLSRALTEEISEPQSED